MTMDPTAHFFQELDERGNEPLVGKAKGSMRFDLDDRNGETEHWLLEVDKGNMSVSHKGGSATCTVHADKSVFDGIAVGEVNAVTALLRGELDVEGDWELMVMFQRLLPSPPDGGSHHDGNGAAKR
jgi:putative sterol carrier protein